MKRVLGLLLSILVGCARAEGSSLIPGTVTDLTVVTITDTTAALSWTGVLSGDTSKAQYDMRWMPAAGFAWWLAGVTPPLIVTGTRVAGGEKLSVAIKGLKPQTAYTFQLVAFTGTLNINAAFGGLSNTTTATTLATPPQPPPPPPVPVPATVQINSPAMTLTLIPTPAQLFATVKDSNGIILQVRVRWASSNSSVAKVDSTGLVIALGLGVDTITATAGTAIGRSVITVIPAKPIPPIVCGVTPPPIGCGMRVGLWALAGILPATGSYGPWFILDSLGQKFKTVRIVVTDTTP